MTDPITAYQEAIDNAYTAHERLNEAIDTLTDAEHAFAYATARDLVENLDAVAYIIAGNNETARKDRRTLWIDRHLTVEQEAVWKAAQEKRDAEAALELARDVRSLERLRLVMLSTVGEGQLPAQAAEIAHLTRLLNVANAQGALGRHTYPDNKESNHA